ncbi:uncharacterized protein TRIADDRAFT_55804 [Trichoplax adhaerens]|uniref:EF-hand domain-containing protein n=1 Tax=Trichoplax adhaerens TaxID=10228 RepID=B3RVW9_TRIAD|nr:hypothetical protein TRIADDRAFT_55804 [Trichoplax adhaerens]EDV26071.1 hypothetical protein TRIADDRAFT_55804 [Trichoplax adhaerens]|eukprot:XP_002112104.1 hypothetical protein TRIADDRAFT_55804 [Trichoplax adhaerens]
MVDYQTKPRPQTVSHTTQLYYGPHQLKNIKRQVERQFTRRRPKSEPARRVFITQSNGDPELEIPDASMVHKSLPYTTYSARLEMSRRYASSSSHKRTASASTVPMKVPVSPQSTITSLPTFQTKPIEREEPTLCPLPFATPKSPIQFKPDTLPGYYKSSPVRTPNYDIPDKVTIKPEPHPSFTKIQQKVKINYVQNLEDCKDDKVPSYELLPTEVVRKKPTVAQPERFLARYSEFNNSRMRQKLMFVKSHRVDRSYYMAGTGLELKARAYKPAVCESEILTCTPVSTIESLEFDLTTEDGESTLNESKDERLREGAIGRLSEGTEESDVEDQENEIENLAESLALHTSPRNQYDKRENLIYLDIKRRGGKPLRKGLQSVEYGQFVPEDPSNTKLNQVETKIVTESYPEPQIIEQEPSSSLPVDEKEIEPINVLHSLGIQGRAAKFVTSRRKPTIPRKSRTQKLKQKSKNQQHNLSSVAPVVDQHEMDQDGMPAISPSKPEKSILRKRTFKKSITSSAIQIKKGLRWTLDEDEDNNPHSSKEEKEPVLPNYNHDVFLFSKRAEFLRNLRKDTVTSDSSSKLPKWSLASDDEGSASRLILKSAQRHSDSSLNKLTQNLATSSAKSKRELRKSVSPSSLRAIDELSISKKSSSDGEYHRIYDGEIEVGKKSPLKKTGHRKSKSGRSSSPTHILSGTIVSKHKKEDTTRRRHLSSTKNIRIRSIGELSSAGYDPIKLLHDNPSGLNKLESFLRLQSNSGLYDDTASTISDLRSELSLMMQSDDDDDENFQLPAMYTFTSEPQRKAFEAKFEQLDVNGDHRVSIEELRRKMFASVDDHAVKNLMNLFDLDGDGEIDVREFIVIASLNDKLSGSRTINEEALLEFDLDRLAHLLRSYREMFSLIDHDEDGYLLTSELSIMISAAIGIKLGTNRNFVRKLVHLIDKDHSGTIDFVEFMTYIPFFVQLHEAVVNKPVFDESTGKDQKALEREFKKSIKKHHH